VASAAPGPSAAPTARTAPVVTPPPKPTAVERPPTATEGAPPPTPPDAVPTTLEELPAGFWDDDGLTEAPPAHADRREAPVEVPTSRPAAPPPAAVPAADRSTAPPALASLQGLALLQAVFPGRVVKVERAATADDDATDEAVVAEPVDAVEDEPEADADAPPARTP
jgi:hypothetical protein